MAPVAKAVPPNDFGGIKIVVDPGHGGKDGGAIAPNGLTEKDINLSVSKFLTDYLYRAGSKVVLTRSTDKFIPLPGRVAVANNNKADLFVAVHQNSAANSGANRTETYYHHPQSARISGVVQGELVKKLGYPNGGSLQAGFHVIKKTAMRSILTEAAFMSNPNEAQKLTNIRYRQLQAWSIFNGIRKAYGINSSPPAPEPNPAPAPAPDPVPVPAPALTPPAELSPPPPSKLQVDFSGQVGVVQNKGEAHVPAVNTEKIISVRNAGDDVAAPKVVFKDFLGNKVQEVSPFLGAKNSYSFYPENVVGKNFVGSVDIVEPVGQITPGLTAGLVME